MLLQAILKIYQEECFVEKLDLEDFCISVITDR